MFPWNMFHGKQWRSQAPRPRNSAVPSSRSFQSSGLCPKTLLVSIRLGGGAATGHLVTDHQDDERERRSNQRQGLRPLYPRCSVTVRAVYEGRSIKKALPVVGQLDGRLRLSPQGLRGDEALEIKRLFPRQQVIHGPRQFMREHGERLRLAVFMFPCRQIFLAELVLA